MRLTSTAVSALVLLSAASAAQAQEARGMNKHDASIAHYSYNIPIEVDVSPSDAGSLRQDLDQGSTTTDRSQTASRALAPAQLRAPMADLGNLLNTPAANFTLPTIQGGTASLNDALAKGPTLLLFVNGATSQHLQLMQKNLQQFGILGIQVLAVSAEPAASLRGLQQRANYSFPIVSDPAQAIARRYGLPANMPALLSVTRQGTIAGLQVQPRGGTFDLTQATAPLRQASGQAAIAAPKPSAAPQPDVMAVANDPVLDQPAEMLSDTNDAAPVMPAVPSPRSTQAAPVPDSVPKIKYSVPPSSPDFLTAPKSGRLLNI